MTPFLQLAILLAIIIFAAKLAGFLSTRIGQPSVFGELIVGLLLGPSLLNLTHLPFITSEHIGETITELGEIGVLLLMFLAGMELHLSDLARNTKVSAYSGILGVVFPVMFGYLTGVLFGLEPQLALFLGLTLGATSVSISAQTLMELGVLRSRVGLGLLGAAVFDDIIIILLLSIFTAVVDTSGASGGMAILWIVVRMVGFLLLSVAFGIYLLPRLVRFVSSLPISQGTTALALVTLLLYGVAAELVGGMAAITGTFVAGLMFNRTADKKRIESGLSAIAYAMFVPIFFVDIGLRVNIRDLEVNALWFLLAISAVAIAGKIAGSGIGAKVAGFSWWEALKLGIGMVSRGEVGLIVASVGLSAGLVNQEIFSSIVGMILITTLVTPPLLRWSFAHAPQVEEAPERLLEPTP